jgi:CRISPR-associated endonuclease/helicase Cas3
LLPDLDPEASQRLREVLAGVQSTALHGDEDDLDRTVTAALREVAAVCASAGTAHAQMLAQWATECVAVGKRHTVILPQGNDGCEVIVTWQAADVVELLDGNDDAASAGSSFAGLPVTLRRHCTAVAERVEDYARGLGLPAVVRATLHRAGAWHDLGKTDPRFQAMLWGGDALLAEIAAEPLAKSGMDASDRVALRLARERSGYPAGLRHEALSARLTEALLADDERSHVEIDSELLIHLVGAHHGWGRPLAAPIEDRHPVSVTVTSDGHTALASTDTGIDWQSPARFRRLNRRYGRWGLTLLESCLRLADIACSEEGT